MNTEQEINNLKRQVQELLAWKEQRTRQQITYPLDLASKDILSEDFLRFIRRLDFTSVSGNVFPNILVEYGDNKNALIAITTELKQFTANATTDVITLDNPSHSFANDDQIALYTTDTLPAPLSDAVTYYVINSSANTFKVSLTSGGAAIDITDTGTGSHYAVFYL